MKFTYLNFNKSLFNLFLLEIQMLNAISNLVSGEGHTEGLQGHYKHPTI
jgi:hypothetical protein